MFKVAGTPTIRSTLAAVSFLKPDLETVTLYAPAGRESTAYSPLSLVTTVNFSPVPEDRTTTVAPGTAAPVGSETVPWTEVTLTCENATAAADISTARN